MKMMRFVLFLMLLPYFPFWGFGQCNTKIKPAENTDSNLRYQERGNRCEGFFRTRVSATANLELVSCTLGEFRFAENQEEIITLKLAHVNEKKTIVRAIGIPIDLYYRMDTELTGAQTLKWEAKTVLLRDPLTAKAYNIGLLAFQEEGEQKKFIPVVAKSKLLKASDDIPQIVLQFVPSTRLVKFEWKLGNSPFHPLSGSFRDGKPIKVRFPVNLNTGEHTIVINYRVENSTQDRVCRFQLQR